MKTLNLLAFSIFLFSTLTYAQGRPKPLDTPLPPADLIETIEFSGFTWKIKHGDGMGPGFNTWSNRSDAIWVDSDGYLHMRVFWDPATRKWNCTEISMPESLGCGTYELEMLKPNSPEMDQSLVAGMFLYQDDDREYDIEIAHWSEGPFSKECQYVVQPWNHPEHRHRFHCLHAQGNEPMVYRIDWNHPDQVRFATYSKNFKNEWTAFPGNARLIPGQEKLFINFWLYQGQPPTDMANHEMIVKSFRFIPGGKNCVGN